MLLCAQSTRLAERAALAQVESNQQKLPMPHSFVVADAAHRHALVSSDESDLEQSSGRLCELHVPSSQQ